MAQQEGFRLTNFLYPLLILGLAAATRVGYLTECADQGRGIPAWKVQGDSLRPPFPAGTEYRGRKNPSELDNLVHNLQEQSWFGSLAPLADNEEMTAHVAPGYYWIFALVSRLDVQADVVMRWAQCGFGVLTVLCYYFFAQRAFGSQLIAFLVGLLGAIHPFWILNTAELNDGVLATFLLAVSLMLGARGNQVGGVFTSLLFGLALAGLAMVRAALLPFTMVGLLWYVVRGRKLRLGWLCALLACLGYANVLLPWAVHTFQNFQEPVPIVTSTYLHLWMGNNPLATGGPQDENTLRQSLPEDRLREILQEPNQAHRYAMLAHDVVGEIQAHPTQTCQRRIKAGLVFLLGEQWFRDQKFAQVVSQNEPEIVNPPPWLGDWGDLALTLSILLLLFLGFLGWRWSFGWRHQSRLASLAMVWIPLPYLLSHAGQLSGPRLPLDGVLICFAAFALVCIVNPRIDLEPRPEPVGEKKKKK